MLKGKRTREKRNYKTTTQGIAIPSTSFSFCLPDTPDNRGLVAMLTGENAAKFVTVNGMLESSQAQKIAAIAKPSNSNRR